METSTALFVTVMGLAGIAAGDAPLVAGRDVPAPRKVVATAPQLPPLARQAGVSGVVLLEVTVDPTGKPVDIKVLRGEPVLDKAAIDTVTGWRYEPTVVNGIARPVALVTALEFFGSQADALRCYGALAQAQSETTRTRLFAVSRLRQMINQPEAVRILRQIASDPEPKISAAARAALGGP